MMMVMVVAVVMSRLVLELVSMVAVVHYFIRTTVHDIVSMYMLALYLLYN